jgi:single-stranded DNA-binding protein
MTGTLLGTSITGALLSEPDVVTQPQVTLATFSIEEHTGDDKTCYEVYAYGAIASECAKRLHRGDTITIEGRLVQRMRQPDGERRHTGVAIVVTRVWLNHLRLITA